MMSKQPFGFSNLGGREISISCRRAILYVILKIILIKPYNSIPPLSVDDSVQVLGGFLVAESRILFAFVSEADQEIPN